MKIHLDPDERPLLTSRLGLAPSASNAQITAAVAERLTSVSASAARPAAPAAHTSDPDAYATIAAAVRAGKFSAGRAAHWMERWSRDPAGTRRTIARLAAGVVPPDLGAGAGGDDGYPASWLRLGPAAPTGSRVHGE
jgi:hypothetical protein